MTTFYISMKKSYSTMIYLGIALFLFLSGVLLGSYYFHPVHTSSPLLNTSTTTTTEGITATETKEYRSEKFKFTIQYSSLINDIQEESDRVTFRVKDDPEMFGQGFSVLIEKTPYKTTAEWLKMQSKGATKNGVSQIVWIDQNEGEGAKTIITKYVAYDTAEDGHLIYRKDLYAVCVKDETLYMIPLTASGSFGADEDPFIALGEIRLASSLHVW
jgi:hypothetical protein